MTAALPNAIPHFALVLDDPSGTSTDPRARIKAADITSLQDEIVAAGTALRPGGVWSLDDLKGSADPFTQYLNTTRGDSRYDLSGAGASAATAGITSHLAATNPHKGIAQAGGSLTVNSDGSVTATPASGKTFAVAPGFGVNTAMPDVNTHVRAWSAQPVGETNVQPFGAEICSVQFNGVWDSILNVGYNAGPQGNPLNNAEPVHMLALESHYWDLSKHYMEFYTSYTGAVAQGSPSVRPIFYGIDRLETNPDRLVQFFRLQAPVITFTRPSDGLAAVTMDLANGGYIFSTHSASGATVLQWHLQTTTAGQTSNFGLTVDANVQALNLVTVKRWNTRVDVQGHPVLNIISNTTGLDGSPHTAGLMINADESQAAALFVQQAGDLTHQTFQMRKMPGQTGGMAYWSDEGYNPYLTMDANGNVVLYQNVGFYGHGAAAKQTVAGAKGSNAALGSLIAALVAVGLITDSTSA